jgi:hypothetical protein
MYTSLAAITLFLTACSGDDDSTTPVQNVDTSQLLGKWIIYKAVYSDGEPTLYESNGTCGREVLEFTNIGEVSETLYADEDCNFGATGTYSWWVQGGKIAFGAQNSYHHTVTVDGNNLVLDATDEADYIKYYHKAN